MALKDRPCRNLAPIESLLQYRFATPKPLETRPGLDRCKTVPLCNCLVVDSLPAVPPFLSPWMISDRSSLNVEKLPRITQACGNGLFARSG